MKSAKLNDWLQVIGMFGIIASLIFVGVQMKQTHEIALSATYHARTATTVDQLIGLLAVPEWLSATTKTYSHNTKDLTPKEIVALEVEFGTLLIIWENIHYQYEAGFLSDEHWDRNLTGMKCIFELPIYREMYTEAGYEIRNSTKAVIEEVIESATTSPAGCWDIVGGSIYDWE